MILLEAVQPSDTLATFSSLTSSWADKLSDFGVSVCSGLVLVLIGVARDVYRKQISSRRVRDKPPLVIRGFVQNEEIRNAYISRYDDLKMEIRVHQGVYDSLANWSFILLIISFFFGHAWFTTHRIRWWEHLLTFFIIYLTFVKVADTLDAWKRLKKKKIELSQHVLSMPDILRG